MTPVEAERRRALQTLIRMSAVAANADDERWRALREAREAGASLRELAEASGLSHEQVRYRLKKGRAA